MKAIPFFAAIATFAATAFVTPAGAQDLRPTASRLASAWARGDFSEIGTRAARSGLSIAVDGDKTGPFNERQAAAALKRVFEDRETLSARRGKDGVIDGDPRRAFIEISWTTRSRGSRIEEQTTVVLQLVEESNNWRITEIRLMR
jgi:hypothetical protein